MNPITSGFCRSRLLLVVMLVWFAGSMACADDFADAPPVPDNSQNSFQAYAHGLTIMGPRGLISIPVPGVTGKEKVIVGYRQFGRQKSSYRLQGVDYRQQIDESVGHIVVPTSDDAELVLSHWTRERSTTPDRLGLSRKDEILSFGGKFSGAIEERADFCFGIQWAAEDDAALANSDIETLAQLRSVYLTTGSEMSPNLYGYAHLRQCYIPELRIILSDNSEMIRSRELFSQAALALERRFGSKGAHNAVFELLYTDYPDVYQLEESRWQVNLGLTAKLSRFSFEMSCLSVTCDPLFIAGTSIGF